GDLSVTAAIAPAGTAILSLQTGGTITQTAGSTITETSLALRAGGAITLNEANDVATLAATSSGGAIAYTDANALTVSTVDSLTGVSTTGTGTTIDLKTGGLLTISSDIAATNNATVYLTSGAGITEGAAKITTGGALGMSAAGTINVNSATNDVATLAASTSSGTLTYQDANALTVGTVAAAGNFPGATRSDAPTAELQSRVQPGCRL